MTVAAAPTYDPVVPDLSWLWWIAGAAVPLIVIAVVFGTVSLEVKKRAGAYAAIAVVSFVAAVGCVLGSIGAAFSLAGDADAAHTKQVTAWLSSEYGADADITEVKGGFYTGDPFPAVVNGEPKMIRVAKGPKNRLLVFGTDDKPLPKR